jgi:MinD-like ATPase involved in chromosome partitioning or flagellar assembly
MKIGVVGIGGGAGATTFAALLLATWPRDGVLGIEADENGGVWAARYGLSTHESSPTLKSLLSDFRSAGDDVNAIWKHTQQLWGSVPVIVSPSIPYQAANVVHVLSQVWADVEMLIPGESDVIVDAGRWRSLGASASLLASCDAAVVVVRPVVEHLEQLAGETSKLIENGPVGVVIHGDGPFRLDEVTAFIDQASAAVRRPGELSVIGVMASDPKAIKALHTGGSDKALRRSSLVRSIIPIANALDNSRPPVRPFTIADVVPELRAEDGSRS